MASNVNRYDQATPARDNYFNTFVPLPLDQLTALGMSRKQDLDRNQALLEKAYNDVLDIKYIKESPFEEANYRGLAKGINDLALESSMKDLSNPIERNNMLRRLRQIADPTLIKRMEESYAAHEQAKALRADLMSKGLYNDLLNEDPAARHNSATGMYNWLPEAYMGREKLLDPYFKDLEPTIKDIDKNTGMVVMGIDDSDISRIANPQRAQELLSTPAGRQEIRLFKKQYPNIAEGMGDIDIMNRILKDYGEQKKRILPGGFIPEYAMKAMGYGQTNKRRQPNPLEGFDASTVTNFEKVSDITNKINELKEKGDLEGAKDLEIAMKELAAENKLDLASAQQVDLNLKDPYGLAKIGTVNGKPPQDFKPVDPEALKKFLGEMSSTTAKKYAYGFTSDQIANATDSNGKKIGLQDFETMSNNLLVNPSSWEIVDVNGKGVLKDKKLKSALSYMNTKDLINVDLDLMNDENRDYKPVMTLGYANEKDGKTTVHKVKVALTDRTAMKAAADNLYARGNYQGASAIYNPQVQAAVTNDNFDEPKTYKILTPDGKQSPITVQRNPKAKRKFDITFDYLDNKTGQVKSFTKTANSRIELAAEIYNIMSQNVGLDETGDPIYSSFSK